MKRKCTIALAASALFLTWSPISAHAYSALYVFGDSLSDAGNVFLATIAPGSPFPPQPVAPYVNGQFSNGPIWVEDLSAKLGLGPVLPSLAGGTDFAFGGATTGFPATSSPGVPVPTVAQQVGLYLGAVSGVASPSALYSVWIGSNDVLNIIGSGVTGATALLQAQGAALTEVASINALAAAGAKNFLVPLVSDLGAAPVLAALGPAAAAGTSLAEAYDALLEADLAGLASTPGIDLSFLDTFALLNGVSADPGAFGLTDATHPCYVGLYTGGGTVCADPAHYLFWDTLHPTEAGHAIIAEAAFDALPEPGTLALLGAGIAGLAVLRRRAGSRQRLTAPTG
jgi:phospholipase/lecithinase/hemolysin